MHTTLLLVTGLVEVLRPTPNAHHFIHRNTPSSSTPTTVSTIQRNVLLDEPQCRFVSSALKECEIRTPGFTVMESTKQAMCLCYDRDNVWIPSIFDDSAKICAAHASTVAAPEVYSALHQLEGFCEEAGTVQIPSTAAPTSSGLAWCNSVNDHFKFCASTTPGFINLDQTAQAACLCYGTVDTTTFWQPLQFDGAVSSCGYAANRAGKSAIYEKITSLNSFCSSIGDCLTLTSRQEATTNFATTFSTSSDLVNSTLVPFNSVTTVEVNSSIFEQSSSSQLLSSELSTILPASSSNISPSILSSLSSSLRTATMFTPPSIPIPIATVPPSPGISKSEDSSTSTKRVIAIGAICALLVLFL